ncbi:MAG: glycosyl hydrolase family 28-related protein [Acidiferrobacterales bacterium]|nr:glycosyl hydrolase family 28-related protein [Acidiferrobacterales bacterium]
MPEFQSSFSGTQIDKGVRETNNEWVASLAALKSLSPADAQLVRVRGGGVYLWVDGDTTSADNNGFIVESSVGTYVPGGVDEGRWKMQSNGVISVDAFGADPTGVADSTTAINNALIAAFETNRAALAAAGDVMASVKGQGRYLVSDTIKIPHTVTLSGSGGGRGDFMILADDQASWGDKAVVSIGGIRANPPYNDLDQNAFGAVLRNAQVHCNSVARIGVESFYANELSGLDGVWIHETTRFGLFFCHTGVKASLTAVITDLSAPAWFTTSDNSRKGTAQNYFLRDLEITFAGDGDLVDGATGAMIYGGGADIRGIDGMTASAVADTESYSGITDTAGIRVEGASGVYERIHVENVIYGIRAGQIKASNAFVLSGISSNSDVNETVHIDAADAEGNETAYFTLCGIAGDGVVTLVNDQLLFNTANNATVTGPIPFAAFADKGYVFARLPAVTDKAIALFQRHSSSKPMIQFLNREGFSTINSTGTNTSAVANKLVDSGATFLTDGAALGDFVRNVTDGGTAVVTALDSETQLSLSADIFTATSKTYNVGPTSVFDVAAINLTVDPAGDGDTAAVALTGNKLDLRGARVVGTDYTGVTLIGNGSNPADCAATGWRPARGTSFPAAPVDGEEFYRTDHNMKYFYDGSRTKWLSSEVFRLGAGRSGTIGASNYLRMYNGVEMNASGRGYSLPWDSTIIGHSYTADAATTGNFEVRRNGVSQLTISHATNAVDSSFAHNADVASGGNLTVFNDSGGSIDNATVELWLRRRAS